MVSEIFGFILKLRPDTITDFIDNDLNVFNFDRFFKNVLLLLKIQAIHR